MNLENALIPNLITSFHFYNLDIKFKSFLFSGFLASSIAHQWPDKYICKNITNLNNLITQ